MNRTHLYIQIENESIEILGEKGELLSVLLLSSKDGV